MSGLSACSKADPDIARMAKARELAANNLRDPASTQFRNERMSAQGAYCAELNAKNGFGAYLGFMRVVVSRHGGVYLANGEWFAPSSEPVAGESEVDATLRRAEIASMKLDAARVAYAGAADPLGDKRRKAIAEVFEAQWNSECADKPGA